MDPKKTTSRNPVESIASDYAESVRGGQRLSVDSVAEANPEHESELRALLPVIEETGAGSPVTHSAAIRFGHVGGFAS